MSNEKDTHSPEKEGGLHAPPGLGFPGKVWFWFHFLILVNLARLRFIILLAAIGLVIINWDWLVAIYEKWTRPAHEEHAAANIEYFCPMHPSIIRDNPKQKCPICFMPLSRRKKGDAQPVALPPGIVSRLQLSPYRVVLAGIKTWQVKAEPLVKEIVAVGSVEFNESGMKQVAARVKGRLDKLFVNETGQMVDEGDELALLYSPDLNVTMQNLVDAKRAGNADLLRIARERLELWGISPEQIEEVLRSGKANTHLKIHSPQGGHVLKKYVKEGQYVEEGSPLYDIVDLATVWIQAQVYEEDMVFLPTFHQPLRDAKKAKQVLQVTATTGSGETFHGGLTFVYPHVDQETRTVVARFEVKNPGHKLRPGTTATVKFKIPPQRLPVLHQAETEAWWQQTAVDGLRLALSPVRGLGAGLGPLLHAAGRRALLAQGRVLAVPDSAVIDTGDQKIVYREIAPAEYEGVLVQLGPRMLGPDDVSYYPILRGLETGDRVVTAGSFLVDAETRLNPAAGSIYFGGSGAHSHGGVNVRPSTPADSEAKVQAAFAKLSPTDRRLAEAQGFCPVMKDSRLGLMGTPVKVMVLDQPVFLCCESCRKGALANPKETLAKLQGLKKKGHPN
jgi:Cu(I)/Ag(I) efflux system membrane fusion protein